ncbi:hypothetical protein K8I85_19335, partial [bacterium]|nr:hypothetical protein [bacterium]
GVLTAALLASACGPAAAGAFLDLATGDEGLLPDARSVALGRTRLAQPTGAFTGRSNPALLARLERGAVSVGGSVLRMEETRAFPAFDSFDGFLVESIYVFNDEYQWEQGIGAAYPYVLGDIPVGFGLSVSPVRDFQYDYSEEVRDNNAFTQPRDRLIALNEVQSDGALVAWSIAAGCSPREDLDVGVAFELLRGKHDALLRTLWVQDGTTDATRMNMNSLDGRRFVVGAAYRPHHRVTVAGTWTAEAGVGGDSLVEGDVTRLPFLGDASATPSGSGHVHLSIPQEVALGLVYRPRALMETSVRLDATWTEWSAYENTLVADPELADIWEARAGIEHVFYNGMPVRFGFRWSPSPTDEDVATTAFTFGAGFRVGALRADLAFEVASREYRYEDLFDDAVFGGTTRVRKDLVEENGSSMFATVTYDLPSFGS